MPWLPSQLVAREPKYHIITIAITITITITNTITININITITITITINLIIAISPEMLDSALPIRIQGQS